jgi:hypothetical protein
MAIDQDDVVFAVYHAGGATQPIDGFTVAESCRASSEDVDAPLADAVAAGLLSREQDPESGRLVFRLTKDGEARVMT